MADDGEAAARRSPQKRNRGVDDDNEGRVLGGQIDVDGDELFLSKLTMRRRR